MLRVVLFAIASGLLAPLLATAPAQAQFASSRTHVSILNGDDANSCSTTAPCRTFAGAIAKTASAGEINCLQPGGYGHLIITKSISIDCRTAMGAITASHRDGIVIDAGPSDKIHLKGLKINGFGNGITGIRFNTGSALLVEDSDIIGFGQWAIAFNNGALASFELKNVTTFNNSLGGLQVRPNNAGAVATGTVTNFTGYRNGTGVELDGNGGSAVNVIIDYSSFSNNDQLGVSLTTGTVPISAMITNSKMENNGVAGISASANATARLGANQIAGNRVGVTGNVFSFGNNQLRGNSTEGSMVLLSPGLQ
jgi:hypothetical protein